MDLMSKKILKDKQIMNMVLAPLVGDEAASKYVSTDGEWIDGKRVDALFIPLKDNSNTLSPVLIEIQHTVDKTFLHRLIKYSNRIYDEYNKEPVVLTLCVERVSSNVVDMMSDASVPFMKLLPGDIWAKNHFIITPDILKSYLDGQQQQQNDSSSSSSSSNNNNNNKTTTTTTTTTTEPPQQQQQSNILPPLAALALVFASQKQSLFEMNKYKHDPTITLCYKVAKDVFAKEIQEQESAVDAFKKVAKQTKNQFKRIHDEVEANGPDMRKKIKELANNGILYTDGCLHQSEQQQQQQQQTEGSMSPPPQILAHLENPSCSPVLDILAPPLCNSMSDLEYAKNWKNKYLVNNKRMNWKECFDDGKKHGKFKNYKNAKNLKNTYNEKYSSSSS